MKRTPMPRRRTPLVRKLPLKAAMGVQASSWTPTGVPARKVAPKRSQRRYTGPDEATRAVVGERDGDRCVRCNASTELQVHHRRPRGMGGSRRPDTNQPQNLITLDTACHVWVESRRERAIALGYLVPQERDPALVPIRIAARWFLLTPDGRYEPAGVAL